MSVRRVGVIGAGIVGLAVARRLLLDSPDLVVEVVEKEPAVAGHQTGHNSGVVHAGIYYTPGSEKARLCVAGVRQLRAYCETKGLAFEACGKVVVALDAGELPGLRSILERGRTNGVRGLRWLEQDELRELEPHAAGLAAVHSPTTAIVDFVAVAHALAEDVRSAGGVIHLRSEVTGLAERGDEVVVTTSAGEHVFDLVVACAGLQADRVARMVDDSADPMIIPFRGEYLALRPERTNLVRGLIYPVPDPRYPFLGVHLTRQIGGGVTVGPNAVLALSREGYRMSQVRLRDIVEMLRWPGFRRLAREHWRTGAGEFAGSVSRRRFVAAAQRYLPELRMEDVVASPAGVRAQAVDAAGGLVDDFRITRQGNVVNVRNAPSPAATSSLAIADHIVSNLALRHP
jgi:L-2-hydroxyglutarate oxidase LhgO